MTTTFDNTQIYPGHDALLKGLAEALKHQIVDDFHDLDKIPKEPATKTAFELPLSWFVRDCYEHEDLVNLSCLYNKSSKRPNPIPGNSFVVHFFPDGIHPEMDWTGPSGASMFKDFDGSDKYHHEDGYELDKDSSKSFKEEHILSLNENGIGNYIACVQSFMGISFKSASDRSSIKNGIANCSSFWIVGPCKFSGKDLGQGQNQTPLRVCYGIIFKMSKDGAFINYCASFGNNEVYPWNLQPYWSHRNAAMESLYATPFNLDEMMFYDAPIKCRFSVLLIGWVQKMLMEARALPHIYLQVNYTSYAFVVWLHWGFIYSMIHHQIVNTEIPNGPLMVNAKYPECPDFVPDALPIQLAHLALSSAVAYVSGSQDETLRMLCLRDKLMHDFNPPGRMYYFNDNTTHKPTFPRHMSYGHHPDLVQWMFRFGLPYPQTDLCVDHNSNSILHHMDPDAMAETPKKWKEKELDPDKFKNPHVRKQLQTQSSNCANVISTMTVANAEEEREAYANVYANEYILSVLLNMRGKIRPLDLGVGTPAYNEEPSEGDTIPSRSCWYITVLFYFYASKFRKFHQYELRQALVAVLKRCHRIPIHTEEVALPLEVRDLIQFCREFLGSHSGNVFDSTYLKMEELDRDNLSAEKRDEMMLADMDFVHDNINIFADDLLSSQAPAGAYHFAFLEHILQSGVAWNHFPVAAGWKYSFTIVRACRRRLGFEFNDDDMEKFKGMLDGASKKDLEKKWEEDKKLEGSTKRTWQLTIGVGKEPEQMVADLDAPKTANFLLGQVNGTHYVSFVPKELFSDFVHYREQFTGALTSPPTFTDNDYDANYDADDESGRKPTGSGGGKGVGGKRMGLPLGGKRMGLPPPHWPGGLPLRPSFLHNGKEITPENIYDPTTEYGLGGVDIRKEEIVSSSEEEPSEDGTPSRKMYPLRKRPLKLPTRDLHDTDSEEEETCFPIGIDKEACKKKRRHRGPRNGRSRSLAKKMKHDAKLVQKGARTLEPVGRLTKPMVSEEPGRITYDKNDLIAEKKYMEHWWKRENQRGIEEGEPRDYKLICRGRRVFIPRNFKDEPGTVREARRTRDCRKSVKDWPFQRTLVGRKVHKDRNCFLFKDMHNTWFGWKRTGEIRTIRPEWVELWDKQTYDSINTNYEGDPQCYHGFWFRWRLGYPGAPNDNRTEDTIQLLQRIGLPHLGNKFLQGQRPLCLVASFASTMFAHGDGLEKAACKIMDYVMTLPPDQPLEPQKFVDLINKLARGYRIRRLKEDEISGDFFGRFSLEPYFSRCISIVLRQCDDTCPHAVALYRGAIYDSSCKTCLLPCQDTFDYLCSPIGFKDIERAYVLEKR